MNDKLGTQPVGKLLLSYSIPGIIGMLVTSLYNIVDRIFIGKIPGIGADALAGLGITMPLAVIILAFAMLVGVGAAANISIKQGQRDKVEAAKLLGNAFVLATVFGVALTVLGLIFCNPLLALFGGTPEIMGYASEYMMIIFAGTLFNLFSFAINSTIRSDGSPIVAGVIMMIGCGLNIILDPIFIFIFNLGIKGAAIATVISQMVTAGLVVWYYLSKKCNIKLTKATLTPNVKTMMSIMAIGVSPFSMQIASSVVIAVLNKQLIVFGGTAAVGAYTIINSVAMLFMMVIFGINQGAQPIIGYNYGAGKYDRATKTFKIAVLAGTAYLIFGTIVTQLFPDAIISLFNNDPNLLQTTTAGMRIYLITMPLMAYCVIGSTYFQNVGKAKISIVLSLLRQCILLLPALYILPSFFGINGIWVAQPICDAATFILLVVIITKEFNKYKKIEPIVAKS